MTLFDGQPPLGRAGRVYDLWHELVIATERSASALRPRVDLVRDARRYRSGGELKVSSPSRDTKRRRYVEVLVAWAGHTSPPYTATSYEEWRRRANPETPNRNTLAGFFGCWRDALAAAGLPCDGSRSAQANARAVETAAAARAVSRVRRRAAVLRAVDRCWSALGRMPTASEFFRWRLESAPDSPSQPDLYRLFPGGWVAVPAALPPRGMAPAGAAPGVSVRTGSHNRAQAPARGGKCSPPT